MQTAGHEDLLPRKTATSVRPRTGHFWDRRQTASFTLVLALTAGLTTVAILLNRGYQSLQENLAQQWLARGDAALSAGKANLAVEDFRNALAYAHDDPRFRLRLAEALLAANHPDEALAHFLSLWQDEPGNGEINLELARIAVRKHEEQDALRYYHASVYGAWSTDPEASRRQARLELIAYLLAHKDKTQAQAEVAAFAGNLPRKSLLRIEAGKLFVETGDYNDALAQYREVLEFDRRNPSALAGVGDAAFHLGRYRDAQRYLEAAVRENPGDSASAQLLQTVNLALHWNPFVRGIGPAERDRRALAAFFQAGRRLQECAPAKGTSLPAGQQNGALESALQTLYSRWLELKPRMTERNLRRDPDLLDSAMDLVFAIEQQAEQECGAPSGPDLALLLIARENEGAAR